MAKDDAIELFDFVWEVPRRGYEWLEDAEAHGETPPFLIPSASTQLPEVTCPLPFDEPGDEKQPLFDYFANLEPTRDAIEEFANKHGCLGIGVPVTRKKNGRVFFGESLSQWREEIRNLRDAVRLWDWLNNRDVGLIHITRPSAHCVTVSVNRFQNENTQKLSWQMYFLRDRHEGLFRLLKADYRTPAVRAALQAKVNKKLEGNASPCLIFDRHGELNGFIRPYNLLTAIWVELYQALLGQRQIRLCIYCHKGLDVTGSRQSKIAHARCSHNAKVNKYRRAKAEEKRSLRRSR